MESASQLGTVWLPLQHLAMLPFVWNESLWRSGIAGAIPSMFAYVLGALGIFRLLGGRAQKIVAYIATAIYAFNPNLLYMQSTAMTEPIFLALFIWTLVYLDDFLRGMFPDPGTVMIDAGLKSATKALEMCGVATAAGALTRYDGWFVAAIVGIVAVSASVVWWRQTTDIQQKRAVARSLVEFLLLNALVPTFWLIFNYRVTGNALDFLNGPDSAQAIALRTTPVGAPPYPGQNHIFMAALYFLKACKLNMAGGSWGQLVFAIALVGTILALLTFRKYGVLLLLWLPLPFYALSMAYGSVPIFMPVWYPYSYYNVRYGLELLPMFAVFIALAIGFAVRQAIRQKFRLAIALAVIAFVACGYLSAYCETPISLREAQVNSIGRISIERPLGNYLATLPHSARILMYESAHGGALQDAGMPLKRLISEGAHPEWEWALSSLPGNLDYMVACEGDPVSKALRGHIAELTKLISFAAPNQPSCVVYRNPKL